MQRCSSFIICIKRSSVNAKKKCTIKKKFAS
jgi:hypothetical protein